MRISMVSVQAGLPASTGVDGRGVHVQELARALVRAGHEVLVYTRRDAPDQPPRQVTGDGVVVERLVAGPAGPLPTDGLLPHAGEFSRALADRLAAAPAHVLHAHSWVSGIAALAAARHLVPEPPLVQTFHALGSAEQQQPGRPDVGGAVRVRMERALARDVAAVIATSSEELQDLVRLGAPRHRVTVLPGGVDVELFSPEGPAAARGPLRRVVSVGRLLPHKGFDTVIRAVAALPDIELVIAGGPAAGSLADDPEATRLRRLAERLGVADRVRLVGPVSRAELPALLRSAELVVCAPSSESFGLVPVEAMACGVPVVATAVGGFLDTVVDGATGTLVPPRRPDRLASAMRKLLAEPFWREAYGTAGVDRVRARYSWDRIAAGTLDVYESVLGTGAGGAGELAAATGA